MSSVETTKERPVEGHGHHDERWASRRSSSKCKQTFGFGIIAGIGLLCFKKLVLEWTGEEAFGLVRMEGRDVERVFF